MCLTGTNADSPAADLSAQYSGRDNVLAGELRRQTQSTGPVPFSEFMSRCLYDPEHGYYATGGKVPGRKGDFYTSVSAGPVFGRLLADGFQSVWASMGSPDTWQIVEQGAHHGQLCRDVLDSLKKSHLRAFETCEYHIVEPLSRLKVEQGKNLAAYAAIGKVRWHARLEDAGLRSTRHLFQQ